MAEQQTTKPVKAATKEQFTIINAKTRAVFIQQPYHKLKEANERLDQLKAKFGKQYELVVARVDEQGNLHDVPKDE